MDTILTIACIVALGCFGIAACLRWRLWAAGRLMREAALMVVEAEARARLGQHKAAGQFYGAARKRYARARAILRPGEVN